MKRKYFDYQGESKTNRNLVRVGKATFMYSADESVHLL